MQHEEYPIKLGKLMQNLQVLEFALRAFLLKYNKGRERSANSYSVPIGTMVHKNSFTSYASLGDLVDQFNKVAHSRCPSYCVDRKVVDIRDIIAHGRVSGQSPDPPYELVKFGREKGGYVPVTHHVTLDGPWFSSRIAFVARQIENVLATSRKLGQNIM